MKLINIHVKDFKSVRDSNEVSIGDVTCFVGKNESGKTAMLQAIYRLNPIVESDGVFDVTDDYPRADVEDYQQEMEKPGATHSGVITASYQISSELKASLEQEFGEGSLVSDTLELTKGYGGTSLTIGFRFYEATVAKHLIAKAGIEHAITNPDDVATIKQLETAMEAHSASCLTANTEATAAAAAIQDPTEKAAAIANAKNLAESEVCKAIKAKVKSILKAKGIILYAWENHLKDEVPKFLYFDEYYQMKGQVNIEQLKQRQAANTLKNSDRPMLGLIELARLDLDKLLNPERTEALVNKLEGASNHLSKKVLKYWSQNRHLQVKFDVRPANSGDPDGMTTGTNLWGRVHDSVHFVSTRLGTRSKGFVWFFSFLAWFSQQRKKDEKLILLLDEPGLFLHAKAQSDLLRYIEEELKPHHQVIYSTHSPFMIDAEHFDRVRIIEDKSMDSDEELADELKGTKVVTEVLEASRDSLFPLQGALGYDIAQTLFVGPNCLVVEGVSDLLYLQTISALLQARGMTGLSPEWTITPVGGSDKVPSFCSLIGSQKKMKLATLIDFQKKDKQKIENLYKKRLLKKKNVLTYADFAGSEEADVEDMFDDDFYIALVNREYDANLTAPVEIANLNSDSLRIVIRLEEYFKTNALENATFNHYRPARFLSENPTAQGAEISEDCFKRFEDAFVALNALL